MPETERFHPAEITKERVVLNVGSSVLVERSAQKLPDGHKEPAYVDDGWKIDKIQKFDPKTGKPFPGEGWAVVTKPDSDKSGGLLRKEIMMGELKEMQATTRTFEEWCNLATKLGVDWSLNAELADSLRGQKMDAETVWKTIFEGQRQSVVLTPGRKNARESMQLYSHHTL